MSTKTTFKRIALVAVAALGFGVLSVVPSQAEVLALSVSTPTAATTGATGARSDTTTASTFTVSALFDGLADTVTVSFVTNGNIADPAGSVVAPRLAFLETATASATQVDTSTVQSQAGSGAFVSAFSATESITVGGVYSISRAGNGYAGAKFGLFLESGTSTSRLAGTYNYTIIVRSYSAGVATPVTTFYPAVITVPAAAVPAAKVPAAGNAKAFIQAGSAAYPSGTVLADSATSGSFTADGTVIGRIKVSNFNTLDEAASDTMTVSMAGPGLLTSGGVTGRNLTIAPATSAEIAITADGNSGEGKITITTAAGATFVKTVTFYDTKPNKVVATVAKAFIKAGTTEVAKVFSVVVSDAAGNPIIGGATVTAAPTDATTTVGGAATCGAYDTTDKVYYCAVKGLSTTKFGPVGYTITATGADTAKTKVTTTATVTFADNVATKAVLAGPASGNPGAEVEYTITLTEKNGYSVADQTYGVNTPGGVLFSSAATGRVASGWTVIPFATTDSFTSVSGVIKSKGTLPVAGTATGTWTLAGDGLQTLTTDAIDKTIGKTTVTVSTEVSNPAADAATAAAEAAEAAAQDATDAALDATTAAEAAGALAQEAVDAVAELSAEVTKLMAGVKAQITYLTKLVMRLAAK
jgi:hypothetical protein